MSWTLQIVWPLLDEGLHTEGGDVVCGCMDESACNYDVNVTNDDSCEYESCLGCTDESACNHSEDIPSTMGHARTRIWMLRMQGNCLSDQDGDGVCDCIEFWMYGSEACNYDEIYTDDAGNCYYAAEYYDCDGNCLLDSDGDGHAMSSKFWAARMRNSATTTLKRQKTTEAGQNDQANDFCEGALTLTCGETLLVNNEEWHGR